MPRFHRWGRRRPRRTPSCTSSGGFTLIEVLVVMIIIAIIAGIAVPVFWHQRAKAGDTSVRADLGNYAKGAQAYYGDTGGFSTTAVDQFSDQQGTPQASAGNHYVAFVSTTAGYPGYVIYGANDAGTTIFELNSFRSNAPTSLGSSPANLSSLTASDAATDAGSVTGTAMTFAPTALTWP